LATQAEFLVREDPDYLLGSPSNLLVLCDHFAARSLQLPRLRQIRSYNEMLTEEVREACRRVFGVEIIDMYSISEAGYLALQCPQCRHYHVQSEGVLLEILDETGQPCGPGQSGRVVITPLHNFATVLLRYEVGDYAEVGEPCPCGRGLPVIRRILGRFRNMAVLPDGRPAWPYFGQFEMRAIAPSLRQFQIVQRSLEEMEFRYVGAKPFTREEQAGVAALMVKHIGHPFRVTFTKVDKIERSASGKFEDFICQVPRPAPPPHGG
jgi:phenylacetate-CoA ligase